MADDSALLYNLAPRETSSHMMLVHLTSNLALLGFALASVIYLWSLGRSRQGGASRDTRHLDLLAIACFSIATAAVTVSLAIVFGSLPLGEASGLLLAAAIGWLTIGGHLLFGLRLIGALVAPLATLILMVQFFMAPLPAESGLGTTGGGMGQGPLLIIHVGLAIVGEAFAIIACAVSVVFLWQQSLLKKKLLDQLPPTLPAIDRIDALLRQSLWLGFILITLGLLSGVLLAQVNPTMALKMKEKVIWATAVWAWYLGTLLARNVFHRSSKRIAQMSLGGFVLLALSYFGIGFMRTGGG